MNKSKKRRPFEKIVKEWKEATPLEVWEGVRDNFFFGFLGATIVVFISTRVDLMVLVGYMSYYYMLGRIGSTYFDDAWEFRPLDEQSDDDN